MQKSNVKFIANWKEHKTYNQGVSDFHKILNYCESLNNLDKEVIVCPSYPFLQSFSSELIKSVAVTHLSLGSQDISRFEEGAYTGEVSIKLLNEFVKYAIIGHSERRANFNETDEYVSQKALICFNNQVTPIVCVGEESQVNALASFVGRSFLVAYEPIGAIGTGHPESPERIKDFRRIVSHVLGEEVGFIYGGSTDLSNVNTFLDIPGVSGLLVGGASLKPETFIEMISRI